MMNLATVFVVALGVMACTVKAEGEIQCETTVRKVGCFANKYGIFGEKLINDRATFDFKNTKASLTNLICRCAKKVAEKGYGYFTINALVECSSGSAASESYYGYGRSDRCLPTGIPLMKCDDNSNDPCTGLVNSNYVYTILEKPPCQDERNKEECQFYANEGMCNKEEVKVICRKTCNVC